MRRTYKSPKYFAGCWIASCRAVWMQCWRNPAKQAFLYPVIQYCVNVVLIMTLNIIKYFFSRNYCILKTIKKSKISTNRFRSNSLSTTQVTHNCSVKATSSTIFLALSYNYNRTYNRNESKANLAGHLARQGCGCRYPEWQHWHIVERHPRQSWLFC